ncbi:MAG: Cation antiporter [Methanomicrobiales archaeon 53_19]|uniref:Na+/H+ antiporter subunit E n=1 Tax=Methanocalculus sp. TaxID=2004547 RepID=UPI000747E11D|nr:Na+/H+ antiporter subunit E [Methanocalculus sp.]KUK70646.1 MAG: Cation antiporter [Methanocalculus sp. 52_23]KUL03263.1 MAG: Cation antiporter [Methanomicrobiales archaeon 53_19]HIJ07268.1 cation:proton antiporter [Methanocalculus sp.]
MIRFLATAIAAFVAYLFLTAGSGTIILWSEMELIIGFILAIIVGLASYRIICRSGSLRMANPVRLILLPVYAIIPLFIEMARANIDVAIRVITGKVRPGIVRVKTGMKTDLGMLLLANSITLTPGTLSVDVDDTTRELYVHLINVPDELRDKKVVDARELFSFFDIPGWIRRIAE